MPDDLHPPSHAGPAATDHADAPTPRPPLEPLARPRVIALINQKGGVGKTTTTVNLGAALAQAGRRVLLIDLDPQAHLTIHVGLEPDDLPRSNYDLLTDDEVTAAEVVQEVASNLAVLPAEVNLAGVETELGPQMITGQAQRVLRDKVQPLIEARDFEYVLIDCPPSLGLLTINALILAREVLVPMQAHFLALQGLSKLFETVRLVRQGFNPELAVSGVVLCMFEGQTILAGEVTRDLEAFFEAGRDQDVPWRQARMLTPPIRRNIKLAECPSFGQTIFDYEPTCAGAQDYQNLAASVERQAKERA